ncbi:palmitoyltransferase ZDHHC19 isoform X2 [Mus musculus]|uniref:palmitoyltransferase ZDHHC19 isoform X2 n=1 Tax=Mus musculus TaxID=10090 RepID=UPI0003D702FC|nr:palmitoyltransferase ZDHHC19 isoform X2 [Mus musculus]XP_030104974.1 palmitoyltransferase ZDHHC19 isoform X2 [Mus musculus]|eukprot:XP_006522198.1 PREDICTED: probable palmitoyltransferase ZDHHC19 isoform X2 [Mus musculus]
MVPQVPLPSPTPNLPLPVVQHLRGGHCRCACVHSGRVDFDHHCKWVNNCIGHRNFRLFMLLVLSLCLYSGALLVTCLTFLFRTRHLPFSLDKGMAILVAVPAAGFLIPLFLLLLIQALSVSRAESSYESKCRYHPEYNPFDQGFAKNWYLAMFAPLGPNYMSEVVCLQRPVGTAWIQEKTKPSPPRRPKHCRPGPPGPQHQPRRVPGKGPPGSGEAAALQEMRRLPASVEKSPGGPRQPTAEPAAGDP